MSDFLYSPLVRDTGLLLLAVVLGGAVGMERERTEHPAGLRTHILVCVGAALIAIIDHGLPRAGGRIVAQVITGIGFLGAGTILRESSGAIVRGLTTAASIWTVAGIGIAVGSGGIFPALALIGTVIVFVTLSLLDKLEDHLNRSRRLQELTFVIATGNEPLKRIGDVLNSLHQLGIDTGRFHFENVQGGEVVHVSLKLPNAAVRDRVKPTLEANPNIVHVEWGPGN